MDEYIDKIVKELNLLPLVVRNQLISHDRVQEILSDVDMKRMIELSRMEALVDGMLENFVFYPIKATPKL